MIAIVPSLKKKRAKTTSGMCTTNICYKLMYMYIQCTILFQVLNFLRNIGKKMLAIQKHDLHFIEITYQSF